MKTFLVPFSFLLCISINLFGQLQVMLVEGNVVSVSEGKEKVIPLSSLNRHETIKLDESGFISLIDQFSNIFEFKGPQEIFLDTLTGGATKKVHVELPLLYQKDKRDKYHNDHPRIEIVHPYPFLDSFAIRDLDKVKWVRKEWRYKYNKKSEMIFVLEVRSFYDDLLFQKETNLQEIILTMENKIFKDEHVLLKVWNKRYRKEEKSEYKILSIVNRPTNDVSLNEKSLSAMLITALYLETRGMLPESYSLYQKAVSDYPDIYELKNIKLNFELRYAHYSFK